MNIMRKFADRTKGTGKLIDSELKQFYDLL